MKKNFISVIMPVYNCEEYIENSIKSIINQTYSDFELIIVNDGSSDNTLNICNKYKKKYNNIKVFNKKNGGVSSARNLGITNASGKYLAFVDADDWIENNTLYEISNVLSAQDIDVLKYAYTRMYGKIKIKYKYKIRSNIKINRNEYEQKVFPYIYKTYDTSSACLAIFKRELIGELRFDESIKYGEDFLFTTKAIIKSNSIYILPQAYYHYNDNVNSATNIKNNKTYIKKVNDIIKVNKEIGKSLLTVKNNFKYRNQRILKEYKLVCRQIAAFNNYENYKKQLQPLIKIILDANIGFNEHMLKKINKNYIFSKIKKKVKLAVKKLCKVVIYD